MPINLGKRHGYRGKTGYKLPSKLLFSDQFNRTNSIDNSFGDPANWFANWTNQGFNINGNKAETKCLVNNNVCSTFHVT